MKKNIFARMLAGCAAVVMMMTAAACGNKTEKPAEEKTDGSLQHVLDSKQLVIGFDAGFPPMGFRDDSGEIVGFDIDMAREVCKRLGVELVTRPIEWDSLQGSLDGGEVDCIWNGMSVTPEREKAMALTEPYMTNRMTFIVRNGSGLKSVSDLKGKKVCVQTGSTSADIIKKTEIYPDISVEVLGDNMSLFDKLDSGGADAVFADSVVAYYFIAAGSKDYYILTGSAEDEEYAVGFRKDDILLRDKIQQIIRDMKYDGTLGSISVKWFGSDITTVK